MSTSSLSLILLVLALLLRQLLTATTVIPCFVPTNIRKMSTDLFEAFDDSDEDASAASPDGNTNNNNNNQVLTFPDGCEQALLVHVQNNCSNNGGGKFNNDLPSIRACVDYFCTRRQWMMHIGPEKSKIMMSFLKERLRQPIDNDAPFHIVELGTYCGYSSLCMIQAAMELNMHNSVHITSIDINAATQQGVAGKILTMAGQSHRVALVVRPPDQTRLGALLQGRMTKIDFLFIDHAKELYLQDLLELEQSGLIQKDTAVCADNVVFFQLNDYREHLRSLMERGIVETKLVSDNIYLEYCNDDDKLSDGLGTSQEQRRVGPLNGSLSTSY
jgi:catechol O-methyltransferase